MSQPPLPPPMPVPQGQPPKPPQKNQIFPIETVFFVMIAMNLLPQGKAIDAAHARNAALFRLAMTLIGVIGLIVTFVVKRAKATKTAAFVAPTTAPVPPMGAVNPWDQAAAWQGIVVTYAMTRQSALRHELIALRRTPTLLSLLFMPVLFSFFTLMANWQKINNAALAGRTALVFLGAIALLGVLSVLLFFSRFPKPDSVRRCITYLGREGIQDVTPDKTNHIPWTAIGKVVENDGDLFFYPSPGNTGNCAIPREAFASPEAGQRFYQAAMTLWQSKGATLPADEALREFGPRVEEPVSPAVSVPPPPPPPPMPDFDLSAE